MLEKLKMELAVRSTQEDHVIALKGAFERRRLFKENSNTLTCVIVPL